MRARGFLVADNGEFLAALIEDFQHPHHDHRHRDDAEIGWNQKPREDNRADKPREPDRPAQGDHPTRAAEHWPSALLVLGSSGVGVEAFWLAVRLRAEHGEFLKQTILDG